MSKDFTQIVWNAQLEDDCRQLVRLAVREDLDRYHDWTTMALVPLNANGKAAMVARCPGVIAGLPALKIALDEMEANAIWESQVEDGQHVVAGTTIGTFAGSLRHLLTFERPLLNLVARLSGIATLTHQYVSAIGSAEGCQARIYDSRKTTPGWRRLEKYAVRCGGGRNHRTGLFDAVLIKDNHRAAFAKHGESGRQSVAAAVQAARHFTEQMEGDNRDMIVEIEVDTLDQLTQVLPIGPDIVLLDNMSCEQLRQAVTIRNQVDERVELEASGGICLENIVEIARSGVERISIGALTHHVMWLDVGMDWVS